MPSKNSINKPKANLTRQRKSHKAAKKRVNKVHQQYTVAKSSKGINEIIPINKAGGVLANTIISNKKAKKLERNLKYAQLRDGKKEKKSDDDMMIDEETKAKGNKVREALWELVENVKVNGVQFSTVAGEGTTIGSAEF